MSNKTSKFGVADMFKANLEKFGFTFCGVFDDETDQPNFIYTIGVTKKNGAEFIIVGNCVINMLHGIMDHVIRQGYNKAGIYHLDDFMVLVDGVQESARIELVDVSDQLWIDECILSRTDDFKQVFQIYFGDLENKLPSKEGNLDSLEQNYFRNGKHLEVISHAKN